MHLKTKTQVKMPVICLFKQLESIVYFQALKDFSHDSSFDFSGRISFLSVFYFKM